MATSRRILVFTVFVSLVWALPAAGDDIDHEPIRYETAPAKNRISRLESRLKEKPEVLKQPNAKEFLQALLKECDVPVSSQILVFSRTSLQRHKISPDRPRALFFNDDISIGTCQNSPLLEISAVDPNLGIVFYTLEFEPAKPPIFTRQNDACMSCHGSSATSGYPGHLVRSVFPDREGIPLLSLGSYRVDHRTPLKQRWGGWYVTGTSGTQTHLGNRVFQGDKDRDTIDAKAQNRHDVDDLMESPRYLHGHSDLVALMVLEHQAEMQNLFTKASFQTRLGMYQDNLLNKELGRPAGEMSETTWRRIQSSGDQVLKYMLFSEEVRLTDRVAGTSGFAKDFQDRGMRDSQGRSLRQLDLGARLFTYPCSYLIHSEQFDALPGPMKDYLLRRLYEVLKGRDPRPAYRHLTQADRTAILEILRATKPDLPEYWRE